MRLCRSCRCQLDRTCKCFLRIGLSHLSMFPACRACMMPGSSRRDWCCMFLCMAKLDMEKRYHARGCFRCAAWVGVVCSCSHFENKYHAWALDLACGTGLAKCGLVGVLVVPGKARGTGPRPGIAAEAASKALVALRGAYHKVVPRWRWCRRWGRGTPLHAARALGVRAIEGKVVLLQENGQTLSHI